MSDFLLKNGWIVSEDSLFTGDVLINGGLVQKIGTNLSCGSGVRVVDAAGKYVLPGMIDSHVHYNAPCADGHTADDFTSGSLGAVFGGVTTIVDYSFPRPQINLLDALRRRIHEASGNSCVDFTFHAELVGWHPYQLDDLAALRNAGLNSLKVYTTYGDDQLTYDQIETLMDMTREVGLRLTVHAEDDGICCRAREKLISEGKTGCAYHAQSRPAVAEITAVEHLIQLAKRTGAQLHIVHVSTAGALERITRARAEGVQVTCETCPHYLLLTEEKYAGKDGPQYIMTPPLRTAADANALWAGLKNREIDSVVSDHCAFTKAEKFRSKSCFETLPGIPGTETILPLLYTEGRRHGLSITDIVRVFSSQPAKLFGLYPRKGCLQPGSDADLVIFDPNQRTKLSADNLHSRSGYCVYEGWPVEGKITTVIRRGEVLVDHGMFCGNTFNGQFIPAVPPKQTGMGL